MIKLEEVSYEYIRRDTEDNVISIEKAVDQVSLQVKAGEFIAVLGHNGSGKSTLAKLLNAILTPSEGTVFVDGIDTKNGEMIWEIRKDVGMVFQNPDNQIVHNVVEEDVGFGPENLGIPTAKIWKRVEEALKKVSMLKYRKKSPNILSGGQKQRVAIAGVLAMHPKCIVLDESTAMLDPMGRQEVLGAVRELNKTESITIIYITHYMEEVVEADYVYVMNQGSFEFAGTPRQVFSQVDRLKELKLGVPQVTELAFELKKSGLPIPDGILSVNELVDVLSKVMR